MSSGLWARTNLLSTTAARQPSATGCLAAGRRSQVLVRPVMTFCYASVSVRDASVRGKGRSPPEQLFHLRTFFQPRVRTSGVSMKRGRSSIFPVAANAEWIYACSFLTKGHKNRRQHSRSTGKMCFMLTHSIEDRRLLPARPNLRHLKDQARDLLRAGEADSVAGAQFQIARRYGFASWPKLKYHVEAFQRSGRAETSDRHE
jgi:hypothetical protein